MGHYQEDKDLPIIVKLGRFKDKSKILSAGSKLKGTDFSMREDYSARLQKRRADSPATLSELALALCLGALIGATAVGNSLVCLSVCLVRRLRHPSNHLLVSLAASDLCVALLVMPPAMHLELTGHRWDLGRAACDAWVSVDVASCTASILNLCMISVDRYLAITRPLTYGVRRTARRAWACIGAVWLLSALISVPPLLVLGNEHGTADKPTCLVCQHLAYQLYATLGAFYIPLVVMLTMYWQIHKAAKKVVEAEHRARPGPRTRSLRVAVRERKASITLGIILTAFTACWLPFFALALGPSLSTMWEAQFRVCWNGWGKREWRGRTTLGAKEQQPPLVALTLVDVTWRHARLQG
ncbi:hypothetical protein HPB48_020404 [Haemaphysalis longicornis]|uniref:G-protein coupled receptors family 1 profile domain-containing protein n=1 Tax=Haemaphysalis longicornis TaxID=44386 RepID=A0A9J6F9U0_HAELO|nr:hypothetical protein HPB48_020404 [Haemaphysalis longicornis]